jgi:hypothetical protein
LEDNNMRGPAYFFLCPLFAWKIVEGEILSFFFLFGERHIIDSLEKFCR